MPQNWRDWWAKELGSQPTFAAEGNMPLNSSGSVADAVTLTVKISMEAYDGTNLRGVLEKLETRFGRDAKDLEITSNDGTILSKGMLLRDFAADRKKKEVWVAVRDGRDDSRSRSPIRRGQ